MSDIKPIKVWLTPPGPNPWKVVFLLEELEIPYEVKAISFADIKNPPLTNINPNGRVPAIEDPNTGLTLWESAAIFLYLVEQYDKEGKLTHMHEDGKLVEKNLERQFLAFQVSGQGPYYGQAGWFSLLHAERIPSCITRYNNEVRRILSVLDACLPSDTDTPFLVGGRLTYADLAFVPYNDRLDALTQKGKDEFWEGLDKVQKWHANLVALPSWKRSMELRARLMDEQGLDWNGMPKGETDFQKYTEEIAMKNAEKQKEGQALNG